jgi:hypothetical protein
VQSFPAPPSDGVGERHLEFGIAGSRSDLILSAHMYCTELPRGIACDETTDVYAGAVGHALTRIRHCEGAFAPPSVSIDRHLAAFPDCGGRLVVHDLTGTAPDESYGSNVAAGQIGGRFVAWFEGTPLPGAEPSDPYITVYDRKNQRVSYTISRRRIGSQITSFTLQRDGTIAFASDPHPNDSRVQDAVAWASPRHPIPHRVRLSVRAHYAIELARGRLAFARATARGAPGRRPEIGIANLRARTHLISRHAAGYGIGFDGRRVSFAHRVGKRVRISVVRAR